MNTLKHHGVLGMKWGVRRYQRKDGSLTPAGKKHVAAEADKKATKPMTARQKAQSMSNDELNAAIDRKKKEKEYISLSGDAIEQGNAFVANMMSRFGTKAVQSFVDSIAGKGGQAAASALLKKVLPPEIFKVIYTKK